VLKRARAGTLQLRHCAGDPRYRPRLSKVRDRSKRSSCVALPSSRASKPILPAAMSDERAGAEQQVGVAGRCRTQTDQRRHPILGAGAARTDGADVAFHRAPHAAEAAY
jgi:hypothetical protein